MSISLYDLILFVHIAAAIHLLGTALVTPKIAARVRSAATRAELATWIGFLERVLRGNPPMAMVLLASGVYLGSQGWWNSGWFYLSIFSWLVSTVLAAGVVKPAIARIGVAAAAGASSDTSIDSALDTLRNARGWALAEKAMTGSDIAILWIMIAKPELLEASAIWAGLVALMTGLGALRRRRAGAVTEAAEAAAA